MLLHYSRYESPLGSIMLAAGPRGLCALGFVEWWDQLRRHLERWHDRPTFQPVETLADVGPRLSAYFSGEVGALDSLAVDLYGTPFQQKVWSALRKIPPGKTTSYDELACAVGCAGGARAVGAANGANPVSLVVPCHRVVRADGHLGGYGGGVERKAWLLRHEGAPF
jgi:O-6-methylguanine DNA methyltransferase